MFTELIKQYATKKTSGLARTEPAFFQYLKDTTPFLSNEVSSTQRLWHHTHQVFAVPICDACNKAPVNWDIVLQQYRKYCSRSCSPPKTKERTNFKKCPMCNAQLNSTKHTTCSVQCRELYDQKQAAIELSLADTVQEICQLPVLNSYQGFKVAHPCLYTNIQRHTVHLPTSYQVKQRIDYLLSPDEYDTKITQKTELIEQAKTIGSTPQEIAIRARYSSNSCPRCQVRQRPVNFATRMLKKWCDECSSQWEIEKMLPKPVLPKKVTSCKNLDVRLNSRDWLYDQHYNHKLTKQQIATLLSVDKETVTNRFKLYDIVAIKHKFKTAQQNEVLEFIKSLGISNIIENDRTLVPPKQIDIYLPDYNLAIEYCGLYWHSTSQARITPSYHKYKMDQCQAKGVRLLTIFSNEWINTRRICELKIQSILGLDARKVVYGRTTTVSTITTDKKREFFEVNHIQGNGPSSYNIALHDECGTPVAVMGFIISDSGSTVTLNRYATSCRVVGGFSKLLRYATNHQPWTRIVSFADLRWSDGNLYETTGFTLEATIPPDYYYTKGAELIHKFNFRHSRLPKILGDSYDPTMSETENTKRAKWYQIFDCGKQRWVMNL